MLVWLVIQMIELVFIGIGVVGMIVAAIFGKDIFNILKLVIAKRWHDYISPFRCLLHNIETYSSMIIFHRSWFYGLNVRYTYRHRAA